MNEEQERQLKVVVNSLSRAEQINDLPILNVEYKKVRKMVETIYTKNLDIETVLQVEQILNAGNVNVLGNSPRAYERMDELAGKAAFGLKQYGTMRKNPKSYVAIACATREGIGICQGEPKVFYDSIPFDSVRAALTQFRKEMARELSRIKMDKFPENKLTNKMRLDATITAERQYLEEFLSYGKVGKEDSKQKHLAHFDKRMKRLLQQIGPQDSSPHAQNS